MKHLEELAASLLQEHGLHHWKFRWDHARTRFGCCHYSSQVISLSKKLTALRSDKEIRNTLLHEIAHALVGYENHHNRIWRNKAIEIGCDGKRCSNDVQIAPRFVGTCPSCGTEVLRHRRKEISCSKCDRNFNPRFLFRWKETVPGMKAVREKKMLQLELF
jgi:predicted SprT family Zn-dependent metalloprotease